MKKIILAIIYNLFLINILFAQQTKIINSEIVCFQITQKKDTINFIVADTSLHTQKPILLFCQGSLPIPLIFKYPNNILWVFGGGINNFDYRELLDKYHVVVISMPATPLIANITHLNKSYCFVEDTSNSHSYKLNYLKQDNLETYVQRANRVLKYIFKQKWSKKDSLCLMGHSQGSKIALEIALSRKDVTRVGLFAFNPLGRIDQKIRQLRKDVSSGKINWEYAQNKTLDYYQFIKDFNNPDSLRIHPEYISWKSFSKPLINEVTSLKCPVYIAYGTEDITSDACDLLPIYFEGTGKKNYTIKRYIGLDHNFFPTQNASPKNPSSQWPQVVTEFFMWLTKVKYD